MTLLLLFSIHRIPMLLILFVGRAVIASALQVAYLYTPEVRRAISTCALSANIPGGWGRGGGGGRRRGEGEGDGDWEGEG